MTFDEVQEMHCALSTEAWELAVRKNHDYTSGNGEDFLHNFRRVERMGICDAATATRTRLLDKLARLESVVANREMQVDEAIKDTILYAFNYLAFLEAIKLEDKEKTA